MNNGQVAGYVNFYHALEEARGKSTTQLRLEMGAYERRQEEVERMPFLKRLFADRGDPEIHIINGIVLNEKEKEERPLEARISGI